MKLEAFGITDVGCVRSNNEDNFVCDTARGLFMVCDGMGGHAAGEVASAMACDLLIAHIDQLLHERPIQGPLLSTNLMPTLLASLDRALLDISSSIAEAGTVEGQKKGMGTTCTAVWFVDHEHALVAHIGDSRLYLSSPEDIGIVTTDHTLVEELVARGLINAEEAKRHPQAHILARALGAQSGLGGDCFMIKVAPHDTLLLCSDGLHAYLPDEMTFEPPSYGPASDKAAANVATTLQAMIDDAKARGGHDNLTGVMVHVLKDESCAGAQGTTSLHQQLQMLRSHPALQSVPLLLLRRLACALRLQASDKPIPAVGIFWPTTAPLTVADSAGRHALAEGQWYAPCPLGPNAGAAGARLPMPLVMSDGALWHLPDDGLVEACKVCPAIGARILSALCLPQALLAEGGVNAEILAP